MWDQHDEQAARDFGGISGSTDGGR
jgi:hypothetical protein